MWIPTHYVVLFVAILLLESAALFIYTLIGLLKQNPLPWIMPPMQPDMSMSQNTHQVGNQIVRGGPQPQNSGQELSLVNTPQASVQVVTSTSVLIQTSIMPMGEISGAAFGTGPHETINSPGSNIVLGGVGGSSFATVTVSASASSSSSSSTSSATSQASASTTSSSSETSASHTDIQSATSTSSGANEPSTITTRDGSPSSTQAPPINMGGLLSLIGTSSGSNLGKSTSQVSNVVTRMATLTSIVPASQPPRPTSTTVVVVPAPPAPH